MNFKKFIFDDITFSPALIILQILLESGDASSSNLSLGSPVNLEVSGLSELLEMSDALDTDNESIDPSFDSDESLKCDTVHSLYCTLT